jgi:hypothetical protein
MAPRELQEFAVGGVIHRFDAHDARRDCRIVCLQVLEQLELGSGRTDNQDFVGILDRVGDRLVVRVILRQVARSDSALFVMQVLVLRLRMDDACFGIIGVELDDVRFAVVDPDDKVIWLMAFCCLAMLGGKYTSLAWENTPQAPKKPPNFGRISVRAALSEYSQWNLCAVAHIRRTIYP